MQWFSLTPWIFKLGFFLLYVLVTALSLPVATGLSLLAGALFGLWQGALIVSVASGLGALLAMLTARYVLSNWFWSWSQRRWGGRMAALHQGLERDGPLYLFAMRLTPAVPFFLVNVLMGLTRVPALTFYWVSQLGMLPLTVVYVNAGVQLGQLRALSDIASPTLIASLAGMGLMPLLLQKGLLRWRRWQSGRRLVQRWQGARPRRFDRNLIVIGAGAAGLVTAYIAAAVRAKVTLIEAGKMGGDCLNEGCVPSKALLHYAHLAGRLRQLARKGLWGKGCEAVPELDFKAVMAHVHSSIEAIAPHDSHERYTALGVEVLQGHAVLCNPWTVRIRAEDGREQMLTARAIVLATGAVPVVPPWLRSEVLARTLSEQAQERIVTSQTLWQRLAACEVVPGRIVVVGGGPMGCELAQALQQLGACVTLVERAPQVLQEEDAEVASWALAALQAEGVRVLTNHTALRVQERAGATELVVQKNEDGSEDDHEHGSEQPLAFDLLLCAMGRTARVEGFGLEALGMGMGAGIGTGGGSVGLPVIETNAYLQTIYPNIYVAGDAAGPYQFTHAAAHQAWYAAVNALFGDFKRFKVDNRVMPRATFMTPQIARVGLNEREAKAQAVAYELTCFDWGELDRAIMDDEACGCVRVLTAKGSDTIVGATIVGAHAAELLMEFVLAMKHGLGLRKILRTTHIYPTFAQANHQAAGAWQQAHQPRCLLALLARFHAWRRRA